MLTTSTHDTKRGEDARARINVLSEIPAKWSSAISRWARANASARTLVGGEYAPDRSDEYLYYQALLGAWPAGATGPPERGFVARMREYMQKAVKEKKTHTSWMHPSAEYDNAVSKFVERSLTGRNSRVFLPLFLPFQERIAGTRHGQLSLPVDSQDRLAGRSRFLPGLGVMGSEPGGSRQPAPGRFPSSRAVAREHAAATRVTRANPPRKSRPSQDMLSSLAGRAHQTILHGGGLCGLRRRLPEVFVGGEYIPLVPQGPAAQHVVAFARVAGNRRVLVIAPRLVAGLCGSAQRLPIGTGDLARYDNPLAGGLGGKRRYRNIFTGEVLRVSASAGSPRTFGCGYFQGAASRFAGK